MECRPNVLVQHKVQVFRVSLGQGLSANPATDEVDQDMDSAKFGGSRLRRRADRLSVPQVNYGGEKTFLWKIQVAPQHVQSVLVAVEQDKGMSLRGERVGSLAA